MRRRAAGRAILTVAIFAAAACISPMVIERASAETETGLEGTISQSPIHGGPAIAGVSDTGPVAKTEFEVFRGETVVASFTTDEAGRFRIQLAPGHYNVGKKGSHNRKSLGFYGPFEVEVRAGEMKTVNWMCNTGML